MTGATGATRPAGGGDVGAGAGRSAGATRPVVGVGVGAEGGVGVEGGVGGAGQPGARFDLAALRAELAAAPEAGRLAPIGLREVVDGDGALDDLEAALARYPGAADSVLVLATATPITIAGADLRSVLEGQLRRRFPGRWVTLGSADGTVHADEATVAAAAALARDAGCVLTVGSGTITDIGKAATPAATPLLAVQTATSVNGYADPLSVLLRQGVKRTTPTRWPDTLIIDPAVLAEAPPELNRAGVGDLMAMFTCAPDWYLAAVLPPGGQRGLGADPAYHATVAAQTRRHGDRLLAIAASLAGDPAAVAADGAGTGLAELARVLTVSGIGMGVAGSTAPASGMEHAISHLLEMAATARDEPASFHGAQVGAATVLAAATWALVRRRIAAGALDRGGSLPDPDTAEQAITRAFAALDPTGGMAAECFADYAVKLRALTAAGDPLAGLRESWATHEAALDELLASPAQVASGLVAAGLPASLGELPVPVSDEAVAWAVASCGLQRRRVGVADLALLTGGWSDADVAEVMAEAAGAVAAARAGAAGPRVGGSGAART